MNIYEQQLEKNSANFVALSPVSFVERSAEVFGDLPAVVHGQRRYTWAQIRERSARLAASLRAAGVGRGSTVSVMLPNTPEMVEAHYAVPALNAVLNTLNTRLDAPLLAWQMNHCEAAVLITDREFAPVMAEALRLLKSNHGRELLVIDVADSEYIGAGERVGAHALHRCARALRQRHHLHDLRQHRGRAHMLRLHDQCAAGVERGADQLVAHALGHGQRLAGEHGLVERAAALDHHAVDRHLFAGPHAQLVANVHVGQRNVLF